MIGTKFNRLNRDSIKKKKKKMGLLSSWHTKSFLIICLHIRTIISNGSFHITVLKLRDQ